MPTDLDVDVLNLLGSKLNAIGYIIALEVAEKNSNNEDSLEIFQLTVLSNLLILLGDSILLVAVLKQNEESDNNEENCESHESQSNEGAINDSVEESTDNLNRLSGWLNVIADSISLQVSLIELEQFKTTKMLRYTSP